MPKLSMHRAVKGNTFKFINHHVKQLIAIAGTQVLVHKYLGPVETGDMSTEIRQRDDFTQPNYAGNDDFELPWENTSDETNIQDLMFLENRDRKYEPNLYDLRGHYLLQDKGFDLSQFGIMFNAESIVLNFHQESMISQIGRKLMAGDVFELTHLRDEDLLNKGSPINRYFVVEDAYRPTEGYDPHWMPHMWSCRCVPVHNQQEFLDILERQHVDAYREETNETVSEAASILNAYRNVESANQAQAESDVPLRNYDHVWFYITPSIDPETGHYIKFHNDKYPMILNYGDGEIPNGGIPVNSGVSFPENADVGDWFLRTDYVPNVLFQREDGFWRREEANQRSRWSAAHNSLRDLINNQDSMDYQDTNKEIPKKKYISKPIKPDFD